MGSSPLVSEEFDKMSAGQVRPDQEQPCVPGYESLKLIAFGGMGDIYLAHQVSTGRQVVLKLMSSELLVDRSQQARFLREADLMGSLSHPNVVPVLDSGITDGSPFLVMEYCAGGSLDRRMGAGKVFALTEVLRTVLPVAQGLQFLHDRGILHRDLKPQNILFSDAGTPMITDFGLAVRKSEVGELTQTAETFGSVGYAAPEQQYGLSVDERADQYSLAVIVYEMLTGKRPLGILRRPSERNPLLHPHLDEVLLRALREDPQDRYESVSAFVSQLRKCPWRRAAPNRRWLLVMLAIAVLLCGAFFAHLAVRSGQWQLRSDDNVRSKQPPATASSPDKPLAPERFVNSLGMTLVRIPAGEFLMGSPEDDELAEDNEKPAHRVRISKPFYLGTHEVTVQQQFPEPRETREKQRDC